MFGACESPEFHEKRNVHCLVFFLQKQENKTGACCFFSNFHSLQDDKSADILEIFDV